MELHTIQYPDRRENEIKYLSHIDRYAGILEDLRRELQEKTATSGEHFTIKYRVKSFESYFQKLLKRLNSENRNGTKTPIHDILGIRITCPFLETTTTIEKIIHENYTIVEVERRGNDRSFSEFGYFSTHLIIEIPSAIMQRHPHVDITCCEVQIRTFLQEAWAEVEHELIYKADITPLDEPLRRKLAALNANLTLSDIIFQEIRDYQRQLHRELDMRREFFSSQLKEKQPDTPHPPGEKPSGSISEKPVFATDFYMNLDALLLDALHAHNRKEFSTAVRLYTAILEHTLTPHVRATVFIHRGMALFSEKDYQRALADFESATACEPGGSRAFYHLGIVNGILNNTNASLAAFKKCVEINPYHHDGLFRLARAYFDTGDYTAALEFCEKAIKIKPASSAARELGELIRGQAERMRSGKKSIPTTNRPFRGDIPHRAQESGYRRITES